MISPSARLQRVLIILVFLSIAGFFLSGRTTGSILSISSASPTSSDKKGYINQKMSDVDTKVGNQVNIKKQPVAMQHSPESAGLKAAFVLIAKNEDLARILQTIRHMEDRFNRRFHYDWVFLGTEEFSSEFKETITAYTSGAIKYSRIPADQWTVSPGINKPDFEKQLAAHVEETTLAHDIQEMYKNRFQAGFLARQTVLEEYDYIWKLKPGAEIHCDVDYDVFRYMKDKSSEYGFAIAYPNITPAVESLWKATRAFMKEHPQYIVKDNSMDFISDDGGASYNGCLYERNFEIASSTFWKSEAYVKYFEYLDKQPGFFELDNHWLDGMVATIATALFLPRQSIEFFQYLGVYSEPMTACPIEKAMRVAHNCGCASNVDFTWRMFSCVPRHFKLHQMEKPEGWELYGS